MDFVPPNPRKQKFQKGSNFKKRKSVHGRTIISTPGAALFDDNNLDYDTNMHINDMNDPGDNDSDSSNFSKGSPQQRIHRNNNNDDDQKRVKKSEHKFETLAAAQKQWDNKRNAQQGYNLNGAYEYISSGGTTSRCFDGVRTDRPANEAAANIVDNVRYLSTNDNEQAYKVADVVTTNPRQSKKNRRGHNQDNSLGMLGAAQRKRKQNDHSPFGVGSVHHSTSIHAHPLDEALDQQGMSNRHSLQSHRYTESSRRLHSGDRNFTQKMGSAMNSLLEGVGNVGKMGTNCQNKKSHTNSHEMINRDINTRDEGGGNKKNRSSSFDSMSSVKQGDEDFYAVGGWESQGSSRRNEDILASLDAANQYVATDEIEKKKRAKQKASPHFGNSFNLKRDPAKHDSGNRNRSNKSSAKPWFKTYQKGSIEDIDSDSSTNGQYGESERRSTKTTTGRRYDFKKSNIDRLREPNCTAETHRKRINTTRKKLLKHGAAFDLEYEDEEWRLTKARSTLSFVGSTRQTRSKSKTRKIQNEDEVIEILSSSSEEDSSDNEVLSPVRKERKQVIESISKRNRSVGDLFSIDAARIAVGKKVFKSKCELKFQFGAKNQYILFSWNNAKGQKQTHKVSLDEDFEELRGLNYYIPEEIDSNESSYTDGVDDSLTFIAFRIAPTQANQFTMYTKSYDKNSYITVEVRDNDQFVAMLAQMRECQALSKWFHFSPEIEFYDLKEYTAALSKDTEDEKNNRRRSTRLSRINGKKKGKTSEKPQLVFPFKADNEVYFTAVSKLTELKLARESAIAESGLLSLQPQDSDLNEPQVEDEKVKGSSRTHYITIREDDIERLAPGEFLNDALVDFWMKWISGAPNNPNSDVHIFTSHFMSTLASDGPEAVSSWTVKKKIDIFDKKLIFVPVNSDLHWSLCVVVNPGSIANNIDAEKVYSHSEEGSFLLFLDSLKMHRKKKIARSIYGWLNFEWKRLKKRGVKVPNPFNEGNMLLLTPKIPYQENGCDCGVFVCRYAYNLFQMRNNCFSQFDMWDNCKELFKESGLFEFDMGDIARIRKEMETLIGNLSKVYLRMKKLEKSKKKPNRPNDETMSSENDVNPSSEVAAEVETSEGGNKSDGDGPENIESLESGGSQEVKREDESDITPGEANSSKEKENVENSSDASPKDDELKVNDEQDDGSDDSGKSQDKLSPTDTDQNSVVC